MTLTFVALAQSQTTRQCLLFPSRLGASEECRVGRAGGVTTQKGCFLPGKGADREPPVIPIKRPTATPPKRRGKPLSQTAVPHRRDAAHAAGAGAGHGARVHRGRPHRPLRAGNAFPDRYSSSLIILPLPCLCRCSISPLIPSALPRADAIPPSCSTRRFLARAPSRRCILSFLFRMPSTSDSDLESGVV